MAAPLKRTPLCPARGERAMGSPGRWGERGNIMRIAVIGAGAMGTLASMLLCAAGEEVTVYEADEGKAAAIRENGMRVRGDVSGEARPRVGRIGEAAEPYDVIVIAVGAAESGSALRPLSPFVHRDTIYLSLQDGGAVSTLSGLVGEERAFAALAHVSAREERHGEVEVEECRSFVLGARVPGREKELAGLAAALESALAGKTAVSGDLEREVWRRLEAAAAVSGLCAITGMAPLQARESQGVDAWCGEAARECRRAAVSTGYGEEAEVSPWDDAVWREVKPPMLRDIEAGGKTEIDHMSGRIVAQARAAGIAVPVHSAILTLVREIESGRHRPGESARKELERRIAEEKGMTLL